MKRIHAGRRWQVLAVTGGLIAAVAVGLVATTASAKSRDDVTPTGQPVRRLRVPRPLQAVRGRAPRRDDQGGDPVLRGSPHPARAAPRDRRRCGRRRGDRGRLHSAVHRPAAEPGRPAQVRCRRDQEPLAALEVPAGGRQGRGRGRPRHGRGQPRDLLPQGPVREGRPPDQPRGRLEAVAHVAGLHQHGQALPGQGPEGHVLLRHGLERLQRDGRPAQPGLLQRRRQEHRGDEPEHQGCVQPGHVGRGWPANPPGCPRSAPTGTPATRRASSRP